ncbi:carbohydrate ABC transporter permease [Microlunatus sp. GCM10028923]|uniref:carbohydrate ABC transporter permease n=1 Tax=Microlunatus sp. GCM10028923 TaxID=3273400 RepID=UPI0036211A1A
MTLTITRRAPDHEVRRPPRSRRIKEPAVDRTFHVINSCLLALFALSVLYPLVYVFSSSFSSGGAIASGAVKLWPVGFNLDAYGTIFGTASIMTGFANSVFYAVAGALLGTALTVLAGYPLSRPDLPFRRGLLFFILIPTLFSAGIIPSYVVIDKLGLMNTRWAIVLPAAMSVFNVIITRAFYQLTIPKELLEAARMDGASDARFCLQIALPLSKPIIAVNLLFYGIAQWNGWFSSMLYLTDPSKYPLQLILREILALGAVNPADLGSADAAQLERNKELFDKLRYAVIVVAMIPPLIAYPFVQRHFVKGALIGSLK